MSEKLPNIEVTSVVTSDEIPEDLTPAPGEDFVMAAEGYIQWDGSQKMVVLKLGTAELVLTYDTEDRDSATSAAVLMMSAPQALADVDAMEQEDPDAR